MVYVYGELFGGGYPDKVSNYELVQTGVYYTPEIEYCVFDIKVDTGRNVFFLDFDEMCTMSRVYCFVVLIKGGWLFLFRTFV